MEDRVNELLVNFIGLPAVKESVIDICCPVIECREQKTQLRRSDGLPGSTVEFIVTWKISQLYLALLDGAHNTDDVGEHLIRGIRLQGIILAPMGNIVAVTGQEQQVTAVPHVQTVNYLAVKGLAGLVVLKLGIPQCGEQAVFLTVHYLLSGEYDINEVFPKRAGQSLLQKAQILLGLLLRHHAQGFVQIGNDLFTAVDIASINTADGAFFRAKTAPQLIDFFLVHFFLPRFVIGTVGNRR